METNSISFTQMELQVLCGLLALPSPWESAGRPAASGTDDDEALARCLSQLRQRGAVHPTESEVALPVAELLRLTARPIIDIDIRFGGPRRAGTPRRARLRGDAQAIIETVADESSMTFTPFANADLLLRWAQRCGLDDRPRPGGSGFTAALAVLDACKDAAEMGDAAGAAAVLRDSGIADDDADAFSAALVAVEQTVAVRLSIRAGRVREGIELFWLDAPEQRWALPSILSPFASSAADTAGGSGDGTGGWTVDPATTMLHVTPTDGDELLAAMQAALTVATSPSA